MGNNASAPKAGATPTPTSTSAHESLRQQHQINQRRDGKTPQSVHGSQRRTAAAAPPAPSLTQAMGSTDITGSQAKPISSLAATSPVGSTNSSSAAAVASRPKAAAADITSPQQHGPSKPVDVPNPTGYVPPPQASAPVEATSPLSPFDPTENSFPRLSSQQDMSFITRPPRMPLPIEEEVHTPGSPIIAPADIGEPLESVEALDADGMTRKSSNLSSTTVDEDDAEELRVDKTRPTVPTCLEWLRGGERVYVTGTIFHWNRKQRLHPVEGRPGVFASTIDILPGTHHIRFLVDNNMQTSPDLPTTVDFGNNLVNYIEVNPDDVPATPTGAPTYPLVETAEKSAKGQAETEEEERRQKDRDVPPADAFRAKYPQYLLDYDSEENTVQQNALAAIEKLPLPPSLPGFLAKPILNAATLMKDDNSVLNMPNHTTLNHLATSSIKNGTLAVSATTRYKDKYVTTIVYKPVEKPGERPAEKS